MPSLELVHSFNVGAHRGWSLHDGTFMMPAAAIAQGIDDSALPLLLGDSFRPDGQVELHVNVMLLQWGRELVLIDAGCANAYGKSLGFAGARLVEAGFSREQVTAVLFTHLHLDHVSGAIEPETRTPYFPNARHLVLRDEAKFWKQPSPDLTGTGVEADQQAAIIRGIKDALQILDSRLEFFSSGAQLFDGITAVPLFGHTPFHTGFLLESGDDTVLNAGDAMIDPRLHGAFPDHASVGDAFPLAAAATRRSLLRFCEQRSVSVFGAHFPAPGFHRFSEPQR